jgi:hypothetical protein
MAIPVLRAGPEYAMLTGNPGCETCDGVGTHPLDHKTPCPECHGPELKEAQMVNEPFCQEFRIESTCVSAALARASTLAWHAESAMDIANVTKKTYLITVKEL